MKYLKIRKDDWHTLMESYFQGIGEWETDKEKADFYNQLFDGVLYMVEESNGE